MAGKSGKQGFASMTPEKRREIAAEGGRKAHALGVAHKFNSETGSVNGIKGAQVKKDKAAGVKCESTTE